MRFFTEMDEGGKVVLCILVAIVLALGTVMVSHTINTTNFISKGYVQVQKQGTTNTYWTKP